jgi:hypothetical protein
LVEHQPSKLRVAGSRPVSRSIKFSEKAAASCKEENIGLCLEGGGLLSPRSSGGRALPW